MTEQNQTDHVECPATKDPAVRLFIVAAMCLGFGVWCAIDAYVADKYPYAAMDDDINQFMGWAFNHFAPVILVPIGLVAAVWAIVFLRRVLVADEEGIGYKGKPKVAWSDITDLDVSDLPDKKILRINHSASGKPLVLDAWKLQNFREMVAFIEDHTPEEVQ
ncbi:MAG: hypothetical protein ACLFV7_05720 [Phycisphaerae bacterium]